MRGASGHLTFPSPLIGPKIIKCQKLTLRVFWVIVHLDNVIQNCRFVIRKGASSWDRAVHILYSKTYVPRGNSCPEVL